MTYIPTGRIAFRINWLGKVILRIQFRDDGYTTIDNLSWRDAKADDLGELSIKAYPRGRKVLASVEFDSERK